MMLNLSYRILVVILALLVMPLPAKAEGVFRDFVWGVSKEDVRRFETAVFYKEEGETLVFLLKPIRTEMLQIRPLITYEFKDGGLIAARFEYSELHQPNPQSIVDLYTKHQAELTAQWGESLGEEIVWKDEYYKQFPQFWSRAVRSGDLTFRTRWETPDTNAELRLFHDGLYYRLFYTLAKKTAAKDPTREIFELPVNPPKEP